ncbi:hypothetical protein [Devosia sp.]|uniref:hypothetical protein n=1 Tax=Devosia sp. TaxID=1871048 RepID=UPI00273472A7|nr:hypothetical protein [Devosia sp.]MDP2779754.1 hypothetical protein [Devosia sp.]
MRDFDVTVDIVLKDHRDYRVRALDEFDALRIASNMALHDMEKVPYHELQTKPYNARRLPDREGE